MKEGQIYVKKNIFVFAKRTKDLELDQTCKIIAFLQKFDCRLYIDLQDIPGAEFIAFPETVVQDMDFLIVLGGDGSLLGVARRFAAYNKPILGINLGRLGYLVELEKNNLDAITQLFRGDYRIENRIMLDAKVIRGKQTVFSGIALNDAVVTKGALSRMIHLSMTVDNQLVNQYHADGVVIATPTGSTAYSMSAGGSVVSPELEVFLLTPICPHALTCKPIIVSDRQTVRIDADFVDDEEVILTLDGQEGFRMAPGDYIEITKSKFYIQLIRLTQRNFFRILKQKLEENR